MSFTNKFSTCNVSSMWDVPDTSVEVYITKIETMEYIIWFQRRKKMTNRYHENLVDAFFDGMGINNIFEAFTNPPKSHFVEVSKIKTDITKEDRECLAGVPANIYYSNTGSKVIEVAIAGKSRENVSLTSSAVGGRTFLLFNIGQTESEQEELETQDKETKEDRTYTVTNIKGIGKLTFRVPVNQGLDVKNLKATVKNGLLRVEIPASEEVKPINFEIG